METGRLGLPADGGARRRLRQAAPRVLSNDIAQQLYRRVRRVQGTLRRRVVPWRGAAGAGRVQQGRFREPQVARHKLQALMQVIQYSGTMMTTQPPASRSTCSRRRCRAGSNRPPLRWGNGDATQHTQPLADGCDVTKSRGSYSHKVAVQVHTAMPTATELEGVPTGDGCVVVIGCDVRQIALAVHVGPSPKTEVGPTVDLMGEGQWGDMRRGDIGNSMACRGGVPWQGMPTCCH